MDRLFHEFLGQTMVGLLAVTVGLILITNEPNRTRANLSFGLFWLIAGVAGPTTPLLAGQVDPDHVRVVERLHVLLEAGGVCCVGPYLKSLVDTAQATPRVRGYVHTVVNASYVGAAVFAVLGATFTATRLNDYSLAVDGLDSLGRGGFWLFASFFLALAFGFSTAWVLLARQDVDPGERARAIAYAVASLMITGATFLPVRIAFLFYTLAITTALFGLVRYFGVQGERAAYLSRFMSPQVAEEVRRHGLASVMKPQELDLSIVCIDFRGFTSYTEAVPSQSVIDLISDYHEAIGEVVAEHGGMVKDYAGDGILILVGAPIPRADHATTALALASSARTAAVRVTERWATDVHPLGIGIGVASGKVTVGAIGETAQMEYTAVGTAVNLAARLCSAAEDGQILVDERVAARADDAVRPRGEVTLKGLMMPSKVFEYADPVDAR